jgi:hypothetical protein
MSLKKYITESERAQAFMVEGDVFTVGVNEELAVEFDVVSHTDNSVVVEADDFGLKVLEHCGCQMIADEEVTEGRLGFRDLEMFGSEIASRIDQEARRRGSADMEPGDADQLRYMIAREMGLVEGRNDGPRSECCDAPLLNYENGLGICSDCKEHAGAAPEELDEGKKPWFKDGVPMCSKECCGAPVMECTCPPSCEHCNCHELKKMMEADSRVHDADMDKAADYKRKAAFHKRMGNNDAANYYQKKVNDIFGKGLNINRALDEDADDVADAIKRRIMNMDDFSEMVRKYGVDAIVTAIEDEAEFHSDSDELGSSDISAMVNSVMRSLERSKTNEAEYQGREVKLGKPTRGDVKKYKVYVKNPKTGNVKKVNFGDPNMEIRRDNPAARKNFRARHNCSDKKDRTKAGYWSCRMWSSKPVSKIV